MILSLELEEQNYGMDLIYIKFDFVNKNICYMKNGYLIKNKVLDIDISKFIDAINSYIIHWNNEYINDNIIDGNFSNLKIHTETEVVSYTFKNKFPHNYNNLIEFIKKEVEDYE